MKKRSRWINGSGVERYEKAELAGILKQYREADGWHRGARVSKRK